MSCLFHPSAAHYKGPPPVQCTSMRIDYPSVVKTLQCQNNSLTRCTKFVFVVKRSLSFFPTKCYKKLLNNCLKSLLIFVETISGLVLLEKRVSFPQDCTT